MTTAGRMGHRVFVLTLAAKGLLGLVQLAVAAAILSGASQGVPRLAHWLVAAELAEDPADPMASRIMAVAGALPGSATGFYAIYFAVHGLLHVGVVAALVAGAAWAYPATILVLVAFIVYQAVEWLAAGGAMLIVLSAIDVAVIWLTIREWASHRARAI